MASVSFRHGDAIGACFTSTPSIGLSVIRVVMGIHSGEARNRRQRGENLDGVASRPPKRNSNTFKLLQCLWQQFD